MIRMTEIEARACLWNMVGKTTSLMLRKIPLKMRQYDGRCGVFLPAGEGKHGLVASGRTWEGALRELRQQLESDWEDALYYNENIHSMKKVD